MNIIQEIASLLSEDIRHNNGLLLEDEIKLLDHLLEQFPSFSSKLAEHGVSVKGLRPIGKGAQGFAYSDGKLVVKVTEDDREAYSSMVVMNSDIAGVNKVLYVGKFAKEIPWSDEFGDHDREFYLIIQDLVETEGLTEKEKEIADLVSGFLAVNIDQFLSWPEGEIAILAVQDYASEKGKKISGRDLNIVRQLLNIVRRLQRRGIRFYDVSSGNIGKRDGKYVVFDLGISRSRKSDLDVIR